MKWNYVTSLQNKCNQLLRKKNIKITVTFENVNDYKGDYIRIFFVKKNKTKQNKTTAYRYVLLNWLCVCFCRLEVSCHRFRTANRKCLKALSSTTAPWMEPMGAVWPTWLTWARASVTERTEDFLPWWEQHRSVSLLKLHRIFCFHTADITVCESCVNVGGIQQQQEGLFWVYLTI